MVFMVRLISGLLLLCIVHGFNTTSSTTRSENTVTPSIERSTEIKSRLENVNKLNYSKFTDEDVENKVKPYKFSTAKPENAASLKLKKSESYTSTQQPTQGSSRQENGRSVDIDIEKFISPDFYNAVFTPPISTKDHTSGYGSSQYRTEASRSYENIGQLTTPSTPFFDKKYKEMVDSVNQKLEVDTEVEGLTHHPNHTSDNLIEDVAKNPNGTRVVYKIFENIGVNESAKPGGGHKDVVLETQTVLSIERIYNETTTFHERTPSINEIPKKNLKYLIGDENVNEVKKEESEINISPSPKTNYQLTTKKYSITKPSTDKNDAGIISNKIESDTLKSLITTTTPSSVMSSTTNLESKTTQTPKQDTVHVTANQKESSIITPTTVKIPEQIYQENQIIPIQITSPSTTFPTTINSSDPKEEKVEVTSVMNKEEETTLDNRNISVKNNTVEPEEQQSTTVLIIVQPNEQKKTTTARNVVKEKPVTIASTPRGFSLPITETVVPTTEILTTTEDEEFMKRTQFEVTSTLTKSTTPEKNNDITYAQEVTTKDATSVDIETLEPTITKSSFTKYIISGSTDITPTVEPSTTVFSKTDSGNGREFSTTVENMDEITTTVLSGEITPTLDQTTSKMLGFSTNLNIPEESPSTTEIPESSTHGNNFESTTAVTTEDITSSVLISKGTTPFVEETTTMKEQEATTQYLPSFSSDISTDSPFTKTTIYTLTSDDKTTTEYSTQTTPTPEQPTTSELRFSKGMRFTESSSTPTEIMKDSTAKTDVDQSTTIPVETTRSVDKKTTINVVEETTTEVERTTEPSIKTIATKVTEATSTEILSSFQTSGKNTTEKDAKQTTDNSDINLTTLRLNKFYVTEVPTSSGTNEPIVSDDGGHSSELEGGSGTVVAIVISCVGGVCLIALACLLVVMRNRQKRFNYGQRCKPVSMDQYSVDSVSVFSSVRRKGVIRHSKRSYGNPAFEDPVCMSHPLNFPAISKFAANKEDVEAEYGDIPQIVARTSELPEGCETKNRFANVIPLPESRVFLTPMTGYPNSDYINANYVTGPKNTSKYYIACQAPMSNTVDDFWRMIWEQQCKVILMLTLLFENGAERCFDYLPPSEVLDCHRLFGDYQVTLKKREVKEKYIISSLQLKNMVSNSWREVTHFWYMGWPEKGVPLEANSIIAFLIEARSYMKSATIDKRVILKPDVNGTCSPEVNPVVVHCSPGTGRTGTVITCDIAIREFEQTRQVDIPKIVYRIRRDRASAVQTKEQYAFIYKVIALYATKLAGGSLESI